MGQKESKQSGPSSTSNQSCSDLKANPSEATNDFSRGINSAGEEVEVRGDKVENDTKGDESSDCSAISSVSMELISRKPVTTDVNRPAKVCPEDGGSDHSSSSSPSMELIKPPPDDFLSCLADSLLTTKVMEALENNPNLEKFFTAVVDSITVDVTPLVEAIIQGDMESVLLCLEEGSNVNTLWECCSIFNRFRSSPLGLAVLENNMELVEVLLKNGADTSIPMHVCVGGFTTSQSPLIYAVVMQNHKVVEILLQHKADVNPVSKFVSDEYDVEIPLLGCVALQNDAKFTKILLDRGADVDKEFFILITGKEDDIQPSDKKAKGNTENLSLTALMYASAEVAKLLLDHGAQVDFQASHGGYTALMLATSEKYSERFHCLLAHNPNVDLQDRNGNTALMYAVFRKRLEAVELLLQHNAQVELRNNNGEDALHRAREMGFTDIEALLLKYVKVDSDRSQNIGTASKPFSSAGIIAAIETATSGIHQQMSAMQQLFVTSFQQLSDRVDRLESKVDDCHGPLHQQHDSSDRPKLNEALQLLHNSASEWQNIGVLLGIDAGVLKAIRMMELNNPSHCLREMLTEWLHRMTPPPSWRALAEAVRPYNQERARQIENIYLCK